LIAVWSGAQLSEAVFPRDPFSRDLLCPPISCFLRMWDDRLPLMRSMGAYK